MGWSWSLHLRQAVLCNAIRRAGFSDKQLILDKHVSPPITFDSVLVAGYVDNFGALSGNPELAKSSAERIRDELINMGLPVHPLEGHLDDSCSNTVGFLGLEFDRERNRLANRPERIVKLRDAIKIICTRSVVSG